uniref:Short-chain dehydrogenase/reductase family 16C member 6 n=1 Tax=Steinernema glaseri TaxID=37863 RepID=A0A1I7ZMU0_9BILA
MANGEFVNPCDQPITTQIIAFIHLILQVTFYSIVGAFKALLPVGVLPRKGVKNDVVLITGAGSGIGRLMAVEFAKLGAKLVLWDINEKGNSETKAMVTQYTSEVYTYTVDVARYKDIYAVADVVKSDIGPVDILINNAGVVTGKELLDCPDEAMEKTMAVNTNSNFYTTKAFLSHMLENNRGHIVVIASLAGKFGLAKCVDYCASKFGAVGFAEALNAEIVSKGKLGVHVTTVCPYYIDTGMFAGSRTFAPHLLPVLKPEYVVERIMEAVLTNTEYVYIPRFSYLTSFFGSFLPTKANFALTTYFGINHTMDAFVGRTGKKTD